MKITDLPKSYCVSKGHFVVDGWTISKTRSRWHIYVDSGITIHVSTVEQVQLVIFELGSRLTGTSNSATLGE
jgi:hypothetical protein